MYNQFAENDKAVNKKQRAYRHKNTTDIIEIIFAEGKGFKMVKKKISRGRCQITGIVKSNAETINNRGKNSGTCHIIIQELYSSRPTNNCNMT